MNSMRSLEQLIDLTDPALPTVRGWLSNASKSVKELPRSLADAERELAALQVTTRSPMGALAFETGGVLIDHGWIRVLGAGCERMPRGIATWNRLGGMHRLPGALLVADDVLGGFFAVNGGGLPGLPGNVCFHSAVDLEWRDLGANYSSWLVWVLGGGLDDEYALQRWPGWEREVGALRGDNGITIYPFPSCDGPAFAQRKRVPAPMEELWSLHAGG